MDNCPVKHAKELFRQVEFASVGLYALADLVRAAGDEVTGNDGFIDSLGHLLRIVARDLMNSASEGYLLKNPANPPRYDSPKESA
ncbi:MAG: hypothetical protein V5B44_12615 [Candidatus Accumulibacter necessarius]|jgi:hypothetical protein|uniref:hypothetical protein n=1 Tax=Candidatus Accumulibacter necessarius TaxID=2954386 RepID=UPI002FC34504